MILRFECSQRQKIGRSPAKSGWIAGTLGCFVALAAVPAPAQVVGTLETLRPALAFPEYTPDQKQLVAEQAQFFLSGLYVNRWLKIARYGSEVDPAPAMAEIVAQARTLPTAELHQRIQRLFLAQRDLHLNYNYPEPLACYVSVVPIYFTEYFGSNQPVAVSSRIESFLPFVPEAAQIAIGDTLIGYNGRAPAAVIDDLVSLGAGANNFGSRTRAIGKLNLRFHRSDPVPETDTVELVLQRSDGTQYTVKLPWLVFQFPGCLTTTADANATPPTVESAMLAEASEQDQLAASELFDAPAAALERAGVDLRPSAYGILSYGTFERRGNRVGVIRLSSFSPSGIRTLQDLRTFVNEFGRLLSVELADTAGVIIDIRDNGGGFAYLSERLPELFTDATVPPTRARLLNTDFKREYLRNARAPFLREEGETLTSAAGTQRRYGDFFPIFLSNDPTFPRAYFGPVAILNNGRCYSACDFFSSRMQDLNLATIWGEDLKTGGGGANVWTDAFLIANQGPDGPLKPLPFGQSMRVAWGQGVRVGAYFGQPIEDLGVTADRRARPTLQDLRDGGDAQLRRIASDLAWLASE